MEIVTMYVGGNVEQETAVNRKPVELAAVERWCDVGPTVEIRESRPRTRPAENKTMLWS